MRYKKNQRSPGEPILIPLVALLELSISEVAYEPDNGIWLTCGDSALAEL
jgi:hypothetical protein